MPIYIKIIISALLLCKIIYSVSYAAWEIKNGAKPGAAAALCAAAASLAVYAAAIGRV